MKKSKTRRFCRGVILCLAVTLSTTIAVGAQPSNVQPIVETSIANLKAGIEALRKTGNDDKNLGMLLLTLGSLEEQAGNEADARKAFEDSIAVFENKTALREHLITALTSLADHLVRQKEYPEAEKDYNRALSICRAISGQTAEAPKNCEQQLLGLAELYLITKQYAQAELSFKSALDPEKTSQQGLSELAMAYQGLARVYQAQGKDADAIRSFKHAIALQQNVDSIGHYQQLLAEQGKVGESELLEKRKSLLKLQTKSQEKLGEGLMWSAFLYARSLEQSGDSKKVPAQIAATLQSRPIEIKSVVVSPDPRHSSDEQLNSTTGNTPAKEDDKASAAASPHLKAGLALASQGKHGLAIIEYDKALSIKANLVEALVSKANAEASLRKWSDAEKDASKAIKLDPWTWSPYVLRANCQLNLGNEVGAIGDLQQALEEMGDNPNMDPYRAIVLLSRCQAYLHLKAFHSALNDCNEYAKVGGNKKIAADLKAKIEAAMTSTSGKELPFPLDAKNYTEYTQKDDVPSFGDADKKSAELARQTLGTALSVVKRDNDCIRVLLSRVQTQLSTPLGWHGAECFFGAQLLPADLECILEISEVSDVKMRDKRKNCAADIEQEMLKLCGRTGNIIVADTADGGFATLIEMPPYKKVPAIVKGVGPFTDGFNKKLQEIAPMEILSVYVPHPSDDHYMIRYKLTCPQGEMKKYAGLMGLLLQDSSTDWSKLYSKAKLKSDCASIEKELQESYFEHLMKAQTLKKKTPPHLQDCVGELDLAIAANPGTFDGYRERSGAEALMQRYEQALDDITIATELDPNNAEVFLERATIEDALGHKSAAESDRKRSEELTKANGA